MIFVSKGLQLEVGMHDIDRLIKTSDFLSNNQLIADVFEVRHIVIQYIFL